MPRCSVGRFKPLKDQRRMNAECSNVGQMSARKGLAAVAH